MNCKRTFVSVFFGGVTRGGGWSWWSLALLLVLALGCVSAGAQPFAYVTNGRSNSVSVINTTTNTVVATVAVGIHPLGWPSLRTGPSRM